MQLHLSLMENREGSGLLKDGVSQELPPLFTYITSEGVAGFDTSSTPLGDCTACVETGTSRNAGTPTISIPVAHSHNRSHSISISLPSSPSALDTERIKGVVFSDKMEPKAREVCINHEEVTNASGLPPRKQTMFHSQPLNVGFPSANKLDTNLTRKERFKDKRYNSFKTWSGKLENQLSNLQGKFQDQAQISDSHQDREAEILPAVHRYFDALEGPELETLKASEQLVLPEDKKWPFLLRFPISSFGMCLGLSSQSMLWKTLSTSPSLAFLNISPIPNLILWLSALALTALVSSIYSLKLTFFFEAVRREYYHPVRVNFFFAPFVSCLFLAIGLPPQLSSTLHFAWWYVLMAPILCLELKIYGQWMSGGQRRLSKVANPSNHLSIVGNFVGALLGASLGIKEGPVFFFAVGVAHYVVLFVTLYQRLPTNETLPKESHPVFFLFIAVPSVACVAWAKISGRFDLVSRIAYFVAMFLYASLAVRINFFRGFRFSLAWWAYTFPMTGAAIATIRYTAEVSNALTKFLSIALSTISTVAVLALLISTILHAFVFDDLFPNDNAIAITYKKPKSRKKSSINRTPSPDAKDLEACRSSEDNAWTQRT